MRLGQVLCVWGIVFTFHEGLFASITEDEGESQVIRVRTDREIRNAVNSFNCRNKPRISRFPDPTDCSKFIYCVSGVPYPGFCPSGKYFNSISSNCDLQKNVPCASGAEIMSEGMGPNMKPIIPEAIVSDISSTNSPIPLFTTTRRLLQEAGLLVPMGQFISQTIEDKDENTTIAPTTTTPKPPRLQDKFEFELDCKNKHPCGLYPNTNGDCTTFSECANGARITKHCNGGQLFDTRTLECQEPSNAQCWQEPDSGSLLKSVDPKICSFHEKPTANSYQNVSDGLILTNPLVTNSGSWQSWQSCPNGSYATGIYVWRRLLQSGSNNDQAGVVSVSLNCESPDGDPRGFIESLAPGAPHDGWPSYYRCKGEGIGFRLNSQKYVGPWPNDNLATDNVQLICSCGPPVYKPYELIPGAQNGNRGDWTEEQICKPRQAICGMQTQMADYRERVVGSYDNTGLNNMHMKCCDVPNPATTCNPTEKVMLIRTCENTNGIYPRRCDFESSIGVTYDFRTQLQTVNFHESIGFSIENSAEELRQNFEANLQDNFKHEYSWNEPDELIWQVGNSTRRAVYLKADTKVELYQVVGICAHYIIRTNRYLRNVSDLITGDVAIDYFEV